MAILKTVNTAIEGTVTFVLRVLGAFGACWGTFSSLSVTYTEFFGGEEGTNFMDNPVYAKTALGISTSAALLSAYIIVRDKLEDYYSKISYQEIDVTIPTCNSFNSQPLNRDPLALEEVDLEASTENLDAEAGEPLRVVCRKRY